MMHLWISWSVVCILLLVRDASSSNLLVDETNQFAPVCDAQNTTTTNSTAEKLVQWIHGNGGMVDERQENRRGVAYTTSFIAQGTRLASVPWSIIMEKMDVCELVDLVHRELNQTSDSRPYLDHDDTQAIHAKMSFASWHAKCSNGSQQVDNDLSSAAWLVSRYSYSEYGYHQMIPLRDVYPVKPLESNVRMVERPDEETTIFIASRDIRAGEPLYLSTVPDKFWTWRRKKIKQYLDCGTVNEAPRPIHTNETWIHLRQLYRQIVGPEQFTLHENNRVDGFHGVPIQGRYSPGKGRGLFATGFIAKNTRIWTLVQSSSARFLDGQSYRKFLASVPADMACDLLKFGYIEDMGEDGKPDLALRVDLDEASYTNTAGWDDGVVANIGCPPELKGSDECEVNEYALRDIHEGEEILSDYNDFAIPEAWESFGL